MFSVTYIENFPVKVNQISGLIKKGHGFKSQDIVMLNSIKYLRFQSFKKSLSLSYDIDLFVAVKLSHCYVWNTCIIMVHILQSFCNDSDMSISLSLFIIYLFIHYLCIIKNLVILPTNDTCVGHHIFRNWGRC